MSRTDYFCFNFDFDAANSATRLAPFILMITSSGKGLTEA
jgi:hypothetical protein